MARRRKSGSGTVRERKDGRWEGRIVIGYDERGLPKTKNVLAKTKTECLEKLEALKETIGATEITRCTPEMPFGEWIDFWYQNYCKPALRPYTQTTYEQRIYNQIIPKIGNVPLNQVTAGTLEKFYAHLKSDGRLVRREIYGEGLANSVIRSIHAHCRASLEKARVEGLIRQNPAAHCKLPPKKSAEIEVLTVEEMQRLLIQAKEEGFYEMFLFDLSTGLRRGELLALMWDDINFETGELKVNKQVRYFNKEECLWLLPRESTLDVFYIVGATQGVGYVKNKLTSIINEQNIQFKIHTYKKLCNNKKVSKTYEYNGECVETYEKYKKCLWPTSRASGIQEIADYYSSLMQLGDNYEKIPYRAYPWENDNGIFSSAQNREVVEIEFLVKGIEIIRSLSKESKMYPLGYNLWPSFGFGSFCAFDMNISNACPLVLWWGNLSKEGNPLDNWYPLLPRRSNAESDEADALDWNSDDFEMEKDQYNMCPDCFCYFGHDQDGGNGFCLDCAWKH